MKEKDDLEGSFLEFFNRLGVRGGNKIKRELAKRFVEILKVFGVGKNSYEARRLECKKEMDAAVAWYKEAIKNQP